MDEAMGALKEPLGEVETKAGEALVFICSVGDGKKWLGGADVAAPFKSAR